MSGEKLTETWEWLLASRCQPADVPTIDLPGIYALFLTPGTALPDVATETSGLLYIGMTESSLVERNHLAHKASGFSSPRRSLGALLKQKLDLRAVPRSLGLSASNISNFSFMPEGESRLTDWMMAHLSYGFATIQHDVKRVEGRLIAERRPPLNLKGWANPQAAHIKALRRHCRNDAGRARSRVPA